MSDASTMTRPRVDWTFPAWPMLLCVFGIIVQAFVLGMIWGSLNQRLIAVEARGQTYDRTASAVDKMEGSLAGIQSDISDIKSRLAERR